MKFLAVSLLTLAAVASARHISLEDVIDFENNSAYGYLSRVGVPLAESIRKAEEDPSRIINGYFAALGQFPYQAGLLMNLPTSISFAGGVLVSENRVLTAAHNFNDFVASVKQVTVVLGSITIFTGGTRITTEDFILHENYNAATLRNDIAMINLPYRVVPSSILHHIDLPTENLLNEDFAGRFAIASGFGKTADIGGVDANQRLSFVTVRVLTNNECANSFGSFVQSSNVCTSGEDGKNVCTGDSGGPLAVAVNNRQVLIGITSFVARACEAGHPSGFTRVTYYMDWINERL